jgi:preprotein translocase subunit SecA
VLDAFKNHILDVVEDHYMITNDLSEADKSEILEHFNQNVLKEKIELDEIKALDKTAIEDLIYGRVVREFEEKLKELPEEIGNDFEKAITLRVIDTHWMEHINSMSILMEGISLRGYGNENPLREYTREGGDMFVNMLKTIDTEITMYLMKAEIRQNIERKQVAEGVAENRETHEVKKTPKKSNKVGRNDPCPCGPGRKYKQCCGK